MRVVMGWSAALLALGCRQIPPTPGDQAGPPTAASPHTSDSGTPSLEGPDPEDDLSGLAGLACAAQQRCAPASAAWLGDTCCAFGDALEVVQTLPVQRGVDIAARDDVVVGCSGNGGFVAHVDDDGLLRSVEAPVERCQRIAIGPASTDGTRRIYLAARGDTVEAPALTVLEETTDGVLSRVTQLREPFVMYEGLALVGDHLWVAAHAGGLRGYALDAERGIVLVSTLEGLENASGVAADGSLLYVADEASVAVVDVADPAAPKRIATVPTAQGRKPRDLALDDTHLYVALGPGGLQVFRRDGRTLAEERTLDLDGSIQGVDVRDPYVAVAAWDHLALLERDGLDRVGGLKLAAPFEQTWAVALSEDFLFGMEWSGAHTLRIHEGLVAPELAAESELLAFAGEEGGTRGLWLRNRGPLSARLGAATVDHPSLTAEVERARVPTGERALTIVRFTPPGPKEGVATLSVVGNDPSPFERPLQIPISARSGPELDVGDSLTEAFAFLDPTGADDLANLEGRVTVLAYFVLS